MFSWISHGFPPTSQNACELASLKSPLGVKEHVYVCPRGALQCTSVLGVGYCPGLLVFSHCLKTSKWVDWCPMCT